jgi:hypothetical protein
MPLDALFITCFFLYPAGSAWSCGLCEYESDAGHKNAPLAADYFIYGNSCRPVPV